MTRAPLPNVARIRATLARLDRSTRDPIEAFSAECVEFGGTIAANPNLPTSRVVADLHNVAAPGATAADAVAAWVRTARDCVFGYDSGAQARNDPGDTDPHEIDF